MKQSDFLHECIQLLHVIKKSRCWLLKHNKSKLSLSSTQTELRNMEYAISTITDAIRMKNYIRRKKNVLFVLLNYKHKKQRTQLKNLLDCQFN